MKVNVRSLHRDFAYFYVGLIISFSISGIFLNHRQDWYPTRYEYESYAIKVELPASTDGINDDFIQHFTEHQHIEDQLRRYRIRDKHLQISYENTEVEINLDNGEGEVGQYFKVPVLAQMTKLHVNTSSWWIYYSDIFGASMLFIAITGMIMLKGSMSFMRRGWKLALAGMVFPLVFLFLLV